MHTKIVSKDSRTITEAFATSREGVEPLLERIAELEDELLSESYRADEAERRETELRELLDEANEANEKLSEALEKIEGIVSGAM